MTMLIVGLGNPGEKYAGTRHNIGFEVLARLSERELGGAPPKAKKKALVTNGRIANQDIVAAMPQTFMNLSGESVVQLAHFYKIPPENILVIHDELDFEPGTVRLKIGGGAGGHNGLKSIIQHLGPDFMRLRVGIGKPPANRPGASYVLSKFSASESEEIANSIEQSVDAIVEIVQKGARASMNRINARSP